MILDQKFVLLRGNELPMKNELESVIKVIFKEK